MINPQLTQEIRWHDVIVAIKTEHSYLEISHFLKATHFSVYTVHKNLETEDRNVSPLSKCKVHSKHAEIIT